MSYRKRRIRRVVNPAKRVAIVTSVAVVGSGTKTKASAVIVNWSNTPTCASGWPKSKANGGEYEDGLRKIVTGVGSEKLLKTEPADKWPFAKY